MATRLNAVRQQIAAAACASGRRPEEITLIGVSKFFPAAAALAASRSGLHDLGENRVQEMLGKINDLSAAGVSPRWHLIGTLQKNKVRQIIGLTHLIHSADSWPLLQEIDRRSLERGLVSDVLLQVNASGETTKHGFAPEELAPAAAAARPLKGLRLRGLMTMAPLFDNPDDTRPVFAAAHQLFDRLAGEQDPDVFNILSMGMSHDFRQAIACGATHVRIGTAIFGPRL
ncbi:MAG TPA: YggS family pyridoxal phosphate-dependent enzyme [Clostridiales bacterium]|nr:YggS family pyridoxal phosphate-dependent enzyme [Clostridiales bacterium]